MFAPITVHYSYQDNNKDQHKIIAKVSRFTVILHEFRLHAQAVYL